MAVPPEHAMEPQPPEWAYKAARAVLSALDYPEQPLDERLAPLIHKAYQETECSDDRLGLLHRERPEPERPDRDYPTDYLR